MNSQPETSSSDTLVQQFEQALNLREAPLAPKHTDTYNAPAPHNLYAETPDRFKVPWKGVMDHSRTQKRSLFRSPSQNYHTPPRRPTILTPLEMEQIARVERDTQRNQHRGY